MFERLLKSLEGPISVAGFDTARVLFLTGGVSLIFSPLVFQGFALYHGQTWDAVGFCASYGGGLAAYLGGGGLGISLKDRGVANAINTTNASAGGQSNAPVS